MSLSTIKYTSKTFSEDGASITEIYNENGKKVDSLYIGGSTWNYNLKKAQKEFREFLEKYGIKNN